ncbi:MAG: peptidogalycan biosysnthesis protein, partial [Microvirga sp.]
MSRPRLEIQVRVAESLKAVPPAQWDAMANPPGPDAQAGDAPADTHNPFVSHAFLSALEDSGCVGGRSGWQPVHILVEGGAGEVVAAAPCYV